MIKAVLFDLDGTLLNRDASLAAFIDGQYERWKAQLGHIPKLRYMERFIELDAKGYRWKDEVYEQLIREFGIQGISQEILLEDYIHRFQSHCIPFPGLIETLTELKNRSIRLGIITNGRGELQLESIRSLGISAYFDAILVSAIEGIAKPDPRIFEKALDMLGIKAEEAMYVGDHPGNDVQAANAAGLISVWKKDAHYKMAEADYVIEELKEITTLIERRGVEICSYEPGDAEKLVALFYETVHSVNAADYSSKQLAAWAPEKLRKEKLETWRDSFARNKTIVAKSGGEIVGFCDLADAGYLNRLYVHKDHQRIGIAKRLVGQIEQEAKKLGQKKIRTESSITAKPFFEHCGYTTIHKQVIVRQGVELENYLMSKNLMKET